MLVITKLLKTNNMRKFKHKTTGKVAEKTTSGDFYVNNHELIPCWCVENSNDWKEIIEKDYEILMYKSKINNNVYYDDPKCFSVLNSDWEIFSIHRLSDGVEFKIGDLVNYNKKSNYGSWRINNFIVVKDKLLARSENNLICEFIAELRHIKEPILITEDGYECT